MLTRQRPFTAQARAGRPVFARAVTTSHSPQATVFKYHQLDLETKYPGISLHDITPQIRELIEREQLQEGYVNVLSRHTTTAVTVNENEARLMDDIRQWLRKLAPPSDPYLHNDLHVREAPPNWPGGHSAWVQQEPENAHSHLLSIMIGNTATIPIARGKLALGTWQVRFPPKLSLPRQGTVRPVCLTCTACM